MNRFLDFNIKNIIDCGGSTENMSDSKVLLCAINDTKKNTTKVITQLLTSKKLKSYHIHVTALHLSQDEEFLSDIVVISALHKRLFLHQTDVTSDEAVKLMVSAVIELEGRIDVLLCHIGEWITTSATKQTSSIISAIYKQNLYPHVRFISQVIPHMKIQQLVGHIIVTNSYAGRQGLPYASGYCSARFALEGYLESVAAEVAAHKIWVTITETVIDKEDAPTFGSINDIIENSDITHESKQHYIESYLQERKLLKELTADKLVKSVASIISNENPDLRFYANKSCEKHSKEKFTDTKGLVKLSDVMKFFLNIDLDEIRGRKIQNTNKKSLKDSFKDKLRI